MISALIPNGARPIAVVSAIITLPRIGAWVADLVLDVDDSPPAAGSRVALTLGDDRRIGTIARIGMVEGVARARVVAGAGGLARVVTPIHYSSPTALVVARRLMADVGETLDPSAAPALGAPLARWTVTAQPAALALRALLGVAAPTVAWRHLPSGALWVGAETWPKAAGFTDVIGDAPEDAVIDLVLSGPPPEPGSTIEGRRVDGVELRLTGASATARVWIA